MKRHKKENKKDKDFLRPPRGMHDILPPSASVREKMRRSASDIADFYGFGMIETPILEHQELFERGIGRATELVEKEMYTLRTRGGDKLALRPEGTAGVCRAYIQHGMHTWPQPVKLWYWGPMFRHDAPQHGRFRQFYQMGLECFGEESAAVDAELIQVTVKILEALGVKKLRIEVNSIGCNQCRAAYKIVLKTYYRSRIRRLCPDCKKRLHENPLRLLDCKNEICALFKKDAPEIIERLCEPCHDHFKKLLEFLNDLGYPYFLNPHLVRGLDYYNRTVFEIFPDTALKDGAAQSDMALALAAGGRFDYLMKMLGGPETFAVGAAIGIERVQIALEAAGIKSSPRSRPQVFLVQLGDLAKKQSLKLMEEFRKSNIELATSLGRDSMGAQLKVADRMGAAIALILGQKEAFDGNIILRDMQSGAQEVIPLNKIIETVKNRLKKL